MKKKSKNSDITTYTVLAGLVIAVVAGVLLLNSPVVTTVLVLLGIIAGLYRISEKNMMSFLLVSLVLWNAASIGAFTNLISGIGITSVVSYIGAILLNIGIFVSTAAVVVALKYVYNTK